MPYSWGSVLCCHGTHGLCLLVLSICTVLCLSLLSWLPRKPHGNHRIKSGGPLSGCETPNEHHSIQMLSPKYRCFGADRRATFQCFLGNLTMSLNKEVITQIQKTPVMPCVHSCPTGTPYSRILVLMFARPMMTCILNSFLIHWLSRQMPCYKTLKH